MKNPTKTLQAFLFLGLALIANACVSFKAGWNEFGTQTSTENVEILLQEARLIESTAASSEQVLALIEAFEKVLQADPQNYTALWNIGNYNILMGAAYSQKKKEKKAYYREAIIYCEKAMSTNEAFAKAVEKEKDITKAFDKLTIREINAMGNWYTARFYYFKEFLNPIGRLMNTDIVIQNNAMIERVDQLDPNWFGGANFFSRALYYIAVPEKFGGSKERANDEFSQAIEIGPNFIMHRWGRAKYLYALTGDTEGFTADLNWVIAQDPSKAGNTYPWNIYFQEDAKKMLANQMP